MDGFFDFFTPSSAQYSTAESRTYTDAQKIAAGEKGLTYFHNASIVYSNYPFKTIEQFVEYVNKLSPTWITHYGNSILITNFDQDDLRNLNEDVAEAAEGKLPSNSTGLQIFYDALQEEFSSTSAKISQVWEGLTDAGIAALETAQKVPTILSYFAKYKVAALAVAGIAAFATIYSVYSKKKRSVKASNPKRKKRR